MPLYAVTIERMLVIAADSEIEAKKIALNHETSEAPTAFAYELTTRIDVRPDWLNSIPYGGHDKTVKELLKG